MPFRRLADYTSVIIWLISVVFVGGGLYTKQLEHSKILEGREVHITKQKDMELDLVALKLNYEYQEQWRGEFMTTFKTMVDEMKSSNKLLAEGLSQTNLNVNTVKYKLETIERNLEKK